MQIRWFCRCWPGAVEGTEACGERWRIKRRFRERSSRESLCLRMQARPNAKLLRPTTSKNTVQLLNACWLLYKYPTFTFLWVFVSLKVSELNMRHGSSSWSCCMWVSLDTKQKGQLHLGCPWMFQIQIVNGWKWRPWAQGWGRSRPQWPATWRDVEGNKEKLFLINLLGSCEVHCLVTSCWAREASGVRAFVMKAFLIYDILESVSWLR